MIPYTLIVPSASRPHLLERVLDSLLTHVDQKPVMLIVHDDAAFPDRQRLVHEIVQRVSTDYDVSAVYGQHDPPLFHGPSLHWLLSHVRTQYVLYSQDDHVVVRDLPIARCLDVMDLNDLHHVRFNKRTTMDYKGDFKKVEVQYLAAVGSLDTQTLCVSDHWYFQTSLWRAAHIRPVVNWWMQHAPTSFHEHCEVKINRAFNGQVPEFTAPFPVPCDGRYDRAAGERRLLENPMDPLVRQKYQRTFIWGKIGEAPYVSHIGGDPADWAMWRPRGGRGQPRDTQSMEGAQ